MKKTSWLFILLLSLTVINYPNPFNPKGGEIVTFEVTSDSSLESRIYIYDLAAQLVIQKTFPINGGSTSRTTWNGYTNDNELASNGVYIYRVVNAATKQSLGKGKIWILNK